MVLFKAVGIKPVIDDGERRLEVSSEFFGKKDLSDFADYMSKYAKSFDVGAKFGCKVPKNVQSEPVKFVRTWLKCCGLSLEREQVKKGASRGEYRYRININPESKDNCIHALETTARRFKTGVNAIAVPIIESSAAPMIAIPKRPQGEIAPVIFDMLKKQSEIIGYDGIGFEWFKLYFDISEKRLRQVIKSAKCFQLVENNDEFCVYLKK